MNTLGLNWPSWTEQQRHAWRSDLQRDDYVRIQESDGGLTEARIMRLNYSTVRVRTVESNEQRTIRYRDLRPLWP